LTVALSQFFFAKSERCRPVVRAAVQQYLL
jgi:hypothetical protein